MGNLSWNDVVKHHRTQAGVAVRNGLVSSILMSSRSYADSLTDDQIVYHIALRHQGRLWLRAFEQSRATNSSFRVFRKQAVNEWTDLGLFRVVESQTTGDEAFLKLARATTDAPV